jgi:mRNA interferase RelE/StbE
VTWKLIYHGDVVEDMERVGRAAARRIVRTFDDRPTQAPLSFGAPLAGNLAGFRKLRIGDYRVVYQVREQQVIVFVLAVGHRTALKRI